LLILKSISSSEKNYDVAIVGGGIIGLASARKLITDNPKLKFVLVEKESQLGINDLKMFINFIFYYNNTEFSFASDRTQFRCNTCWHILYSWLVKSKIVR
jgi:glycine/D-amino acid oxidase-like deaminating enzyme